MPTQPQDLGTILQSFGISPYGRDQTAERTNMLLETLLKARAAPQAPEAARPLISPEEEALLAEAYPDEPAIEVPPEVSKHSQVLAAVAAGFGNPAAVQILQQRMRAREEALRQNAGREAPGAARARAKLALISGRQTSAMREADQTDEDAAWARQIRQQAAEAEVEGAADAPIPQLLDRIAQYGKSRRQAGEAKQAEQERHTAEMERLAQEREGRLQKDEQKRQSAERGQFTQAQRVTLAQGPLKIRLRRAERELEGLRKGREMIWLTAGGNAAADASPGVMLHDAKIQAKLDEIDQLDGAIEAVASEALMPETPAPAVAIPPPKKKPDKKAR